MIYVLCCGGTIEKMYSEQSGAVMNLDSKIDRYLSLLRLPDATIETVRLMNKDSLEMTAEDRETVLLAVRERLAAGAPIVISHGTDTMVQTGLFLRAALAELQVPVVLTGAMPPLGFERSDGLQNLTESLLAARILPAGVFVVMHNQVFPVERTRKDRERGDVRTDLGAAVSSGCPKMGTGPNRQIHFFPGSFQLCEHGDGPRLNSL